MQLPETSTSVVNLRTLLPYGAIVDIARTLKISHVAVSRALQRGRPSHPAVVEALRIIDESGTQAVQQRLTQLGAQAAPAQ